MVTLSATRYPQKAVDNVRISSPEAWLQRYGQFSPASFWSLSSGASNGAPHRPQITGPSSICMEGHVQLAGPLACALYGHAAAAALLQLVLALAVLFPFWLLPARS